ncbi:MAG: DUF2231 domain-containing protein [Methylobacterium sp.]|uniref:DUF2231 domain-containing protein n=1 Tax=Methylobacterium sp. TaxID=409 RepID=UPI0025E8A618|nr:DUF2231 domain-containing protein [Methylobacterium sp.]MBX9933561.1 DUF2231 domain-containing protein [Methylobacterium sp.]
MPPIHPAIVHFPIALVVFSVAADLIGSWLHSASLRAAGFWALMAAALAGTAAVAAGYYDMNRATLGPELDGYIHLHLRLGWTVLVAIILLALWRWRIGLWATRWQHILYGTAALVVVGLTAFQGWYGGEMVYGHGASVAVTGQGVEPAETAKQRLQAVYEAFGAPGGQGHGSAGESPDRAHPPDRPAHAN